MSLEVWPRLPAADLEKAVHVTETRELDWLLATLHETLFGLKQNLEDCYKLLGPEPGQGNTLVVSTPRNESVKGHITRRGVHIVKGTIHIRLRTLPHQTLVIDPHQPITIAPLDALHTLLTRSIDLLTLTLAYSYPNSPTSPTSPTSVSSASSSARPFHGRTDLFIATQLRVLAQALADASALLRGPPLTPADPAWTSCSVALAHFAPPLPPTLSFYLGLQDGQLVLWLRALEPVGVPVNLGMKFALALGTTRRIEHDEADKVFAYAREDGSALYLTPAGGNTTANASNASITTTSSSASHSTTPDLPDGPADVYVREKIRVESADPSLMSLSAKLAALNHSLRLARQNLAAVMGEALEE